MNTCKSNIDWFAVLQKSLRKFDGRSDQLFDDQQSFSNVHVNIGHSIKVKNTQKRKQVEQSCCLKSCPFPV